MPFPENPGPNSSSDSEHDYDSDYKHDIIGMAVASAQIGFKRISVGGFRLSATIRCVCPNDAFVLLTRPSTHGIIDA